jgi:phenylpropionate dioxygenase-like ring-hydroxylating dioxygenase large terminal subunit
MRLYPTAWYPFCLAAKVGRGRTLSVRAFATNWCIFRTQTGRVGIVHATCCHMGADLSRGRVVGEHVRCALHAWEYATDGACARIPDSDAVPAGARQPALVATERFGLVWGFLGEGAPLDLPAAEGFEDPLLSWCYVATLALPYPMIGMNAFDTHHLLPLHHRALEDAAQITTLSPRRIRLRYCASVVGNRLYDRLTRALGVCRVEIEIESWDGTQLIFYHRRLRAFTLLATHIVDDDTTRVYLRTGRARRWRHRALHPLDRLLLALHHRLIVTFALQDLKALGGARFRPGVLHPERDREFIQWHRHFAALPRAPVPE